MKNSIDYKYKEAACVLIEKDDGTFLAVARRGTIDQWGLAGGKVDKEDALLSDAAARELKEETGLEISSSDLIFLYKEVDDAGYETNTFVCKYEPWMGKIELKGDAGPVKWITEQQLLDGPFGNYNKKVLSKYRTGK